MYWWLAAAFAVSFVADTFGHYVDPLLVSIVYPVSQAGLAGIALLERTTDRLAFIGIVVWAGVVAVLLQDTPYPDVLLSTVAFGSVAVVAANQWEAPQLRAALLVYFGAGLAAWWAFSAWPSWTTYCVYQSTRLIGILWFCVACWRPGPTLRAV